MKKLITVALILMFVVCLSYTAVAGSIDSPGYPSAGSGMYTLQNLYDYLTSGTALTVQSSFQEPASAPGSTMKSTRQIGDAIKALHSQCNVTAAHVESGWTFFCTQPGSWGVQTGTGLMQPTPTTTPTITQTTTPTITATITPTPTITPTWGQTQCEMQYGGLWRPIGGGASGCWFVDLSPGSGGESCNHVCAHHAPLICNNNYTDLSCNVCHEIFPRSGTTCYPDGTPQFNDDNDGCYTKNAPAVDCTLASGGAQFYWLCVCELP